ncbi:MAG: hypothetical protein Q4D91_11170 [Lautropia sp.]|nr:hypothetical protein [Lautropia sp.]
MAVIAYKWRTGSGQIYDEWNYSVTGLPKNIERQGTSLSAYKRGGIIFKEGCIHVSELTKNSPYNFRVKVGASNDKGDAISVGYSITSGCNDLLEISKASLNTTNKIGYKVLKPVKHSIEGRPNYSGAYIGIPRPGAPNAWGFPLTVNYKPQDAKLKELKLIATGSFGEVEANVLNQIDIIKNGTIIFKNFSIPEDLIEREFNGKIDLYVELRAEVNGADQISPRFPVSISESSETDFTPLFFAGTIFDSTRRYGQGQTDEGGDSWATWKTLKWLEENEYRFNDISVGHIAQNSNGRSVLSHAGHSDGAQLDLRYADGKGKFSDSMGGISHGAHILRALKEAENDVYVKKLKSSKNLDVIIKWIEDNRALLEKESANARVIYAGDKWMKKALLRSQFPSGKQIPIPGGITSSETLKEWESISENIKFIGQHLHHWHISLKN